MNQSKSNQLNPISSLLILYKDKELVLRNYLPDETVSKLGKYIFYQKEEMLLYLNDTIVCISPETGKIVDKGKIISINDTMLTLKKSSYHITIDSDDYFIFSKQKKKSENRDFFKELLKQLN